MRTIKVQIDCSDKYCGKCQLLNEYVYRCDAYDSDLEFSKDVLDVLRCKQCIESEIKDDN